MNLSFNLFKNNSNSQEKSKTDKPGNWSTVANQEPPRRATPPGGSAPYHEGYGRFPAQGHQIHRPNYGSSTGHSSSRQQGNSAQPAYQQQASRVSAPNHSAHTAGYNANSRAAAVANQAEPSYLNQCNQYKPQTRQSGRPVVNEPRQVSYSSSTANKPPPFEDAKPKISKPTMISSSNCGAKSESNDNWVHLESEKSLEAFQLNDGSGSTAERVMSETAPHAPESAVDANSDLISEDEDNGQEPNRGEAFSNESKSDEEASLADDSKLKQLESLLAENKVKFERQFIQPQQTVPKPAVKSLEQELPPSSQVPEYNILLLGESGAGKSTTINAFANYLRFGTIQVATVGDFVELIASKFMLTDPKTGEDFPIVSGIDPNECHQTGASSTQAPMAYQFHVGGKLIRLIDTPGMGDTRGIATDQRNFEKILSYLNYYESLHGVLVLMKANETRQVASFRYCISELLNHLHKSACANIVFCFTFSRNTFFGAGDGFKILKSYLDEEFPEMNYKLKAGENCFFIDNEAYRYLVARKKHFPFPPEQEQSFAESWTHSARQTEAMIHRIINLEAHDLKKTLTLNRARSVMLQLAQPLVQLQKSYRLNLATLQHSPASSSIGMADLGNLEVLQLRMERRDYPNTVCTSPGCTEIGQVGDVVKVKYRICCTDCPERGIETNKIGHPMLKSCSAFAGTSKCSCGCKWSQHMHQEMQFNNIQRRLLSDSEIGQLRELVPATKQTHATARQILQMMVLEMAGDLSIIRDIAGMFGYLLEQNANSSFTRYLDYIELLIYEERLKLERRGSEYPCQMLELLIELKSEHQKDVGRIGDGLEEKAIALELNDIYLLVKKLRKLKYCGDSFRELAKELLKTAPGVEAKHEERVGFAGAQN